MGLKVEDYVCLTCILQSMLQSKVVGSAGGRVFTQVSLRKHFIIGDTTFP